MQPLSEKQFVTTLAQLKSLLFQFDTVNEPNKINLLRELISYTTNKPELFKQFHQVLMAMMAYPSSKALLDITEQTTSLLLKQLQGNEMLKEKLVGTGLLHTAIECNFSYEKVCYLIQQFPQQISIHSASSNVDTQKAILKLILPYIEYSNIHEGDKQLKQRLATLYTPQIATDLEWLISCIQQAELTEKAKAVVYNQLGIFLQWEVTDESHSVSFLRGTNLPTYFHTTALEKKVQLQDIINQKLPSPTKLTTKEKEQLIHSARLTLTYLYRETEPFTNANSNDITVFQLEHGISVALFGSVVRKRYALESYIGYLVLKNNRPASYGGGWLFGERSQFGINILEAFRGGESGLIICSLLRVYHQYFGATCFVVKPYQFGYHNTEALKTGAFWFYYKLGFRPESADLRTLALQEEKQKQQNPHYKSEIATLKKYTKSNLALILSNHTYPHYDAEVISKRITHYINIAFNGNREKAQIYCFKQLKAVLQCDTKSWKQEDIEYAKQLAVLFCMYPDYDQWLTKHKKNVLLLITLKSASTELPWIKHLQHFTAFWDLMEKQLF